MELTLKLSLDKLNIIMQALGNMPYVQVVALVDEIKAQAKPQIDAPPTEG